MVDPKQNDYPSHSPYNYVLNNPIRLYDIKGLDPDDRRFDDAQEPEKYANTLVVDLNEIQQFRDLWPFLVPGGVPLPYIVILSPLLFIPGDTPNGQVYKKSSKEENNKKAKKSDTIDKKSKSQEEYDKHQQDQEKGRQRIKVLEEKLKKTKGPKKKKTFEEQIKKEKKSLKAIKKRLIRNGLMVDQNKLWEFV